jgi:hypothetical protein
MEQSMEIAGKNQADFLRLRGRRLVEAGGVFWTEFDLGSRYFMSLPDHALPASSVTEIDGMLKSVNALAARYPSLSRPGLESGIYLIRDKQFSQLNVHKNIRKRVRQGLNACEIRPVTATELLVQGLQCNLDTMNRQGRFNKEFGIPENWKRFVDAAFQMPAVCVYGAFIEGELAAYILGCYDDGWMHLLYQNSRTDMLKSSPNHALAFFAIRTSMDDDRVNAVCCGPKAVLRTEGLDEFKIRMGYNLEPQQVAVQFHPSIAPVLTSAPVVNGLQFLRRIRPENNSIQRTTAFVSVAREGRLSALANRLPVRVL